MTGQILLTIIMLWCFIISLMLHYLKKIKLFNEYDYRSIITTILFLISLVYMIISLGFFISTNWDKPIL